MTTPLTGYPISTGDKQVGIFDHTGPASYPGSQGETVFANDFCMSTIDFVQVSAYTISGNYIVVALYPLNLNVSQVVLAWYSTATGIQPPQGTNLAGEHIRLKVYGA